MTVMRPQLYHKSIEQLVVGQVATFTKRIICFLYFRFFFFNLAQIACELLLFFVCFRCFAIGGQPNEINVPADCDLKLLITVVYKCFGNKEAESGRVILIADPYNRPRREMPLPTDNLGVTKSGCWYARWRCVQETKRSI